MRKNNKLVQHNKIVEINKKWLWRSSSPLFIDDLSEEEVQLVIDGTFNYKFQGAIVEEVKNNLIERVLK